MTDFLVTDPDERQRLEDQLRAAGINAPGAQFYTVGEPVVVPNPDGSPTSLVPTGWPLVVTNIDRARGTITLTADESMTDRIEPALTAEEWAKYHGPHLAAVERSTLPIEGILPDIVRHKGGRVTVAVGTPEPIGRSSALIAVLNDLLPDSDPRKITRAMVNLIRDVAEDIPNHDAAFPQRRELLAFADALASYLPPEGP